MRDPDSWLTNPKVYEYLNTKEGKALRDYLDDKLSLKEAASELVRHYNLELEYDQSFEKVIKILSLIAIDLSDSCKQRKIVKFLVALRNLRYKMEKSFYSKNETNLSNEPYLSDVLPELNVTMEKDLNYLEGNVLAPIFGLNPIRPESNIQLINLHAFIARLCSVNTCNVGFYAVERMCFIIINNYEIRSNRVFFNVVVSAAAQHMIYSAPYVLKFNMKDFGYRHGFLGWRKWKVGFEEAKTNILIAASAKKDAKLAVAAMNEAELVWKRRHMPRGIDKSNQIQSCIEELEMKQTPIHGTKRSHDEAFFDRFI